MCELFVMSASQPQKVRYELDLFAAEGGEKHRNRDGWGILFAQDRDAYLFREPDPAAESELSRMGVRNERPCKQLIAHVRRATAGEPQLANTHPFDRVVDGRRHAFAHNGELTGIFDRDDVQHLKDQAIGDTDSELGFLLLLERFAKADAKDADARFEVFASFAIEMRDLGSANFLFFDGQHLFLHADRRRFETEDVVTEPREPGLDLRSFAEDHRGNAWQATGASIEEICGPFHLFASVPLDEEGWEGLPRGTCMMVRDGIILKRTIV